MPEIVVDDDPTQTDVVQDQPADIVQDTPPEEPAARASYFEKKFQEEELKTRGLDQDKKRLEGIVEDERTSKGFWKEQAETRVVKPAPVDAAKDDAIDEALEELDLGELAVSKDGGKKLVQFIEKRVEARYKDYVKPADVEGAIDRRLNTIVAQGRLAEQFPDLADQGSEFAKTVNQRTVELAKDPEYAGMSDTARMRMAALEVENETGGRKERVETRNGDRAARVARQSVTGARPARTEKPSTELTEQQKKFARQAGITEKEYADNSTITTYPTLGPQ